jgi:hypothetical protein
MVEGKTGEIRLADLAGRRGALGTQALSTDDQFIYFQWEEPTGDLWVADLVEPN